MWLIFATWVGRKLLGWLFGARTQSSAAGKAGPGARAKEFAGHKLFRDPVCGMHVPEQFAVTLEHGGTVERFCSVECRERFRAAQAARSA